MIGGDEESRTPDPLLARQVLSQLSYTPKRKIDYNTKILICKEKITKKLKIREIIFYFINFYRLYASVLVLSMKIAKQLRLTILV